MRLISVQLARVTWLADVNEFNPRGLNIFSELIPMLVQEYKFKNFPKEGDDLQSGLKLMKGEYVNNQGDTLSVDMTVFNDGVVADTVASTEASEEFLSEVTVSLSGIGFAFEAEMI